LTVRLPKSAIQDKSKRIAIGGAGGKTIESTSTGQAAIGKDWIKQQPERSDEKAEQDQSATA
jgi:hypothetical protein